MNVLIACEESQTACIEFRKRGHRAFSCDLQDCSGGHPEWHVKGDVLPLLNGNCTFQTSDTHTHTERQMGSAYLPSSMHVSHQRRIRQSVPQGNPRISALRHVSDGKRGTA